MGMRPTIDKTGAFFLTPNSKGARLTARPSLLSLIQFFLFVYLVFF
jgi:hypothetical protein